MSLWNVTDGVAAIPTTAIADIAALTTHKRIMETLPLVDFWTLERQSSKARTHAPKLHQWLPMRNDQIGLAALRPALFNKTA